MSIIFWYTFHSRRPKLRFENGVNQEMKTTGVKKCKNAALDKDEWTQFLKKVKAHEGLSNILMITLLLLLLLFFIIIIIIIIILIQYFRVEFYFSIE